MASSQRIIAFGGPDMCGKTQIAQALSRRINVPYFKASSEHQSFLKEQNQFLMQLRYADPRMLDFLRQTGHSAIFDRAWPCEWAYSKFFGRETDLNQLRVIDDGFAALRTLVVVCYRSSYRNIADDLDSRIGPDQLAAIEHLYHDFAVWTSCKTMFLNVDDEDLDREVSDIIKVLP
jgi:thymidylate kinase